MMGIQRDLPVPSGIWGYAVAQVRRHQAKRMATDSDRQKSTQLYKTIVVTEPKSILMDCLCQIYRLKVI